MNGYSDEELIYEAQREHDKCYNCGYYAKEVGLEGSGEYWCPFCGDGWNIYDEPPEVP